MNGNKKEESGLICALLPLPVWNTSDYCCFLVDFFFRTSTDSTVFECYVLSTRADVNVWENRTLDYIKTSKVCVRLSTEKHLNNVKTRSCWRAFIVGTDGWIRTVDDQRDRFYLKGLIRRKHSKPAKELDDLKDRLRFVYDCMWKVLSDGKWQDINNWLVNQREERAGRWNGQKDD